MSTLPNTTIVTESATFIGIDYHKRYSVYHAIDDRLRQGLSRAAAPW